MITKSSSCLKYFFLKIYKQIIQSLDSQEIRKFKKKRMKINYQIKGKENNKLKLNESESNEF